MFLYSCEEMFLGELLNTPFMVETDHLNPIIKANPANALARNIETKRQTVVDEWHGKIANALESSNSEAYYSILQIHL